MVHRLALFIGGVGAAAVLALAMNLGGLFSAAPTAADTSVPDQAKTVIDKVYVTPAPKAPVVHVNKSRNHTAAGTRPRAGNEPGDRGGD